MSATKLNCQNGVPVQKSAVEVRDQEVLVSLGRSYHYLDAKTEDLGWRIAIHIRALVTIDIASIQ